MNSINTMKYPSFIAISALIFSLLIPVLTIAADYPEPGNFEAGAKAWAENCSRCHNMRDPKDLRDDQWITTSFHMRVRAGLTGQQTRDILTFLQASNKQARVATAASVTAPENEVDSGLSGEAVYNQTCIACHGVDGQGTVPGAPVLTRANGPLAQTDEVLIRHINDGFQSPGSPMAMPPKGGNSSLTQADIRNVLVYMREKFGN